MSAFCQFPKSFFKATVLSAIGVVATFALHPARAQYAGVTWNGIPAFGFNNTDGLRSRLSQNGQVGIFGGWGGPVFQTVDGGTTWNQTLTGITPNGIAMSSNGSKIFLAVRDFAIHVSTNSGANWSVVSGLPVFWSDVDCSSDGQTAIACRGTTGSVYVTTNGGLTSGDWTEQTIPGASNINYVACSSDGSKRFAASNNGFIYTWDSGSGWVQRDSSRQWAGLTSSSDGTKLAATVSGGTIYTSSDSGATWVSRESTRGWNLIDSSSDGTVLIAAASGSGGGLFTSYNSGVTWTARATGLTPSNPLTWRGASVSGDGARMLAPIGGGTAPQALYMSVGLPSEINTTNWRYIYMNAPYAAGGQGESQGVYALHANRQENTLYYFDVSPYHGTTASGNAIITFQLSNPGAGPGISGANDYTLELIALNQYNTNVDLDTATTFERNDGSNLPWVNNSGTPLAGLNYNDSVLDIGTVIATAGPVPGDTSSTDATDGATFTFTIPQATLQTWFDQTRPPVVVITANLSSGGTIGGLGFSTGGRVPYLTFLSNDAPTDISLSSSAINENAGVNAVVGALTATDANSGDTHTFSLVPGTGDADNGSFNISGANLRLNASADYETKTSYSVRIQANDGSGGTYQEAFTITVNDLNDVAPEITGLSRYLVTGGGGTNTNVMRLLRLNSTGTSIISNNPLPSASIPDHNFGPVYHPTSGYLIFTNYRVHLPTYLNGGAFTVTPTSGLANNSPWQPHLPSGRFVTQRRNGFSPGPVQTFDAVAGTITDGANHTGGIPEASWIYNGILYTADEGLSVRSVAVAADGSTTGTMGVDATNHLLARGIPQGDGGYTEVSRMAVDPADGTALFLTGRQNIYLFDLDGPHTPGSYTAVNLHTVITTAGGGFTYNPAFTDTRGAVYDAAAGVFFVSGSLNDGAGNVRDYIVRVTKAGVATELATEVTGPTIHGQSSSGLALASVSSSTFSLTENSTNGTAVGTLSATDGDAGATTFSNWTITGGNTSGAFAINASTGQITVANSAAVDFETTPVFSLDITVSDGVNTSTPTSVTINLTNANEPATDITLTNDTILENAAANTVVGTLAATGDPDAGATHTFSLVSGTGSTDNAAFNISGTNLRLTGSANFEAQNSYNIRLRATDNLGATHEEAFTINVVNVNEPPTSIGLSATSLPENGGADAVVGSISAIGDPDAGASHAFTLVSGTGDTDNGDFNLSGNSLRLTANGNFESKSSYSIRLLASDGLGGAVEQSFTITLTNVNEPPTGLNLSNSTIDENAAANTTVGTLAATGDPDALASHGYALVAGTGDTDNAAFNILGNALRLTGVADFETKSSYSVRIQASDGLGGTFADAYTITVNNLPEGATDITLTNATLPENNTPPTTVGTLAAIGDPNPGDTQTLSLVAGTGSTDNGSFLLSGNTLRLNVAANFEVKSSYSIRVRADDGTGGIFEKVLLVSITNVNEPPTDLSLSNTSLPENSGANAIIGTVSALGDPDADATHVFTLVTGSGSTDNTLFNLTGNTLRKVANADFEDRTSYSVRMRADDGLGGVFEKAFTITITNANEAPTDITLSGTTVPENAGANAVIGSLAALGDPDAGATHTFTLVGGADDAAFDLIGTTLRLRASADFEAKPTYSIRVQASDGIDGTFAKVFAISVTNVNEAPTDISLSNATVPENGGANAVVGTVAATGDPDAGATHTYSLVAGSGDTDNASFNLSGASLRLNASANFESKASYSVRIRADDSNGGTFEKAFTISVTNVNEAPTDLTINDATVDENAGANAIVGSFTTVGDPDAGSVHTYSLVSGVDDDDNTAFNINGANLRLTASANFEVKSSYKVRVKTDDGIGGAFEKAFTITVNDVNEAPTDLTLGNSSVPENAGANAVVGTLAALGDPDAGAAHTYSLVPGSGSTDNAAFNIDGTSLRLTANADFETKSSYSVRVRADDSLGGTFEKAFTITVTNVNEAPTDISLSNASIPENAGTNAVVGSFSALGDPDAGATHGFAFANGAGDTDNAAFILSGSSLRLSASANFETKSSYSIRVETSDGLGGTFSKAFTISITNVNEAPTDLSLSNATLPENSGANAVVGTLAALGDPDTGAAHAYSLVPGSGSTDNAAFNIDGASLRLTANADFETKSSYSVRVLADDGLGGTFEKAFTITVTNVNEAPTDINLSNASIPENAGANATVGSLAAIGDPDAGASHSFSLVAGAGGNDNASFNISGTTLRLTASANFEVKSFYQIRVRADDGAGGSYEKPFVVTITDVNEAPSVTAVSATGDEDSPGITVTFLGEDPDSNPLDYQIVTGPLATEGTLGAIADNTVVFTPALNYNGVVSFTYKANDGSFDSNTGTVTVTVNAVNDRPTITDISGLTILEDGTTGPIAFSIADVDAGAVLSVSATSDNQDLAPDGGLVLGGSGENRTITITPEADQNGTATVTVEVSDGLLTAQDSFVVTVTAVNDEPTFDLSEIPRFGALDPNAEGRLWAWGLNSHGQIGDGSVGTAEQPVQVGSQTDWRKIATGDTFSYGIKTDGTLWSWGDNFYGQLGDGTTTARDVPGLIGEDDDWDTISAGDGHVVALKEDGTLWAWGRNDFGQLGNAATTPSSSPLRIGTGTDWSSVSAGSLHTVAVKEDGSLWAWGRNQFGQLGIGSTTGSNVPVRIGTANDWTTVSAGGLHTLALKADGSLWAWGRGSNGQLGDGTTGQSNAPKRIGMDTDWVQIASGYTFSLARKADGSIWAWGRNADGQLADGTRTNQLVPRRIGLENDWEVIAAGRFHGLALKTDGSLWTWGDNDTYQMGVGTTGDFLLATRLGTETWSSIAGGLGHTVAIEPESIRLTIAANSGPFILPGFATDILAGPLDEEAVQSVSFEVENDDPALFVTQPAITPDGTLTLTPGVDAGTLTVTARARDNGGVANGGDDTSQTRTFSITITVAPEIILTGNSVEIPNGDDTPDASDHTDFGETPTVGGSVVRTFTIVNEGTAPLNLGEITLNGSSAFSITTLPAPGMVERLGGFRTFSITFDPATPGLHATEVSIVNDDDDENPYIVEIAGVGITPEISVTGNSTEILNGDNSPIADDHTDFGSTEVVGGSVSRTFTILNTGTQDLTLDGNPLVSISGSTAFTVTTMPAVNPVPKTNGSTPFVVLFDPSSRGAHTAVVSIANNDENEAPYTFTIRGVGLAPEISVTGNGTEILSGDTVPSANDHTLFGSIGSAMTRTFTIVNGGNLVLELGTPAVSLSGSASFSLTTAPTASNVAAEGGNVSFGITFDPTVPGVQTATVSIASDDTDENPYTFTIRGNGLTQLAVTSFRALSGDGRINLAALIGASPAGGIFSGPGVFDGAFNPNGLAPGTYTLAYTVKDAVGQDLVTEFEVTLELSPARLSLEKPKTFPATTVGASSRPQTIEIRNLGGKTAGSVRVFLSRSGSKDFRTSRPSPTIRGKGKSSFQVTFTPKRPGIRKVTLTVTSSSAPPVSIKLRGRGKAIVVDGGTGGGGHLP